MLEVRGCDGAVDGESAESSAMRQTISKAFDQQKASVYRAWTGLAWMFCVTVPDARWACGYERFEASTFKRAIRLLDTAIGVRRNVVHPWRSVQYADPNWIDDRR